MGFPVLLRAAPAGLLTAWLGVANAEPLWYPQLPDLQSARSAPTAAPAPSPQPSVQTAPSVQAAPVTQPPQTAQPAPTPPAPAAQSAQTQPASSASTLRILDELKLGFLAHDVGIGGHHKENGYDLNGEILFASPWFFKYIWSPRPHFGIDGNINGKTTFYYAGLTWDWLFYKPGWSHDDGFFAALALGGSVNDGKISTTDPNRKSLGSHVLFREGLDLGYRLNSLLSLSGFIDHSSNAGLANRNEGITNAGMRVGLKF